MHAGQDPQLREDQQDPRLVPHPEESRDRQQAQEDDQPDERAARCLPQAIEASDAAEERQDPGEHQERHHQRRARAGQGRQRLLRHPEHGAEQDRAHRRHGSDHAQQAQARRYYRDPGVPGERRQRELPRADDQSLVHRALLHDQRLHHRAAARHPARVLQVRRHPHQLLHHLRVPQRHRADGPHHQLQKQQAALLPQARHHQALRHHHPHRPREHPAGAPDPSGLHRSQSRLDSPSTTRRSTTCGVS